MTEGKYSIYFQESLKKNYSLFFKLIDRHIGNKIKDKTTFK